MQPDHAFTPAQPGDTPGQVEPDDSRPKPIDAADPLDEAMIAAANAVDAYVEANPGPHPPPTALIIGLSVRAAAPIIAAPIQADRDEYHDVWAAALTKVERLKAWESRDLAIANLRDANADLRARLATAERERDELRTLANTVLATFVHPGHPGRACLQSGWIDVDTVRQWRERAKEVGGE